MDARDRSDDGVGVTVGDLKENLLQKSSGNPTTRPGNSDFATALVILKTMVGGTLIVIPGAFKGAGILAAPLLLVLLGGAEIYCMALLVECSQAIGGGSYGEITQQIWGLPGRLLVDMSIASSQLGFVCVEMLYVANNANAALVSLGWGGAPSVISLIFLQLLFTIPMAWISRLEYFTVTNFLANVAVFSTLAILTAMALGGLVKEGPAPDLQAVGPDWILFAGTVVYSFEVINCVLPMYEAHTRKESFVPILVGTLCFVLAFFIFFGGINYAYYGGSTKTLLTLNLPSTSPLGYAVPLVFAMASLACVPLLLFPVSRVAEGYFLAPEARPSVQKWKKNGLRTGLVLFCCVAAILGADGIEAFLSLLGSLTCVPLAFLYPSLLHMQLCGKQRSRLAVAADLVIFAVGSVMFVLTSVTALRSFARS